MGTALVNEEYIVRLAAAIRRKNGKSTNYKLDQMPQAILDFPTDGSLEIDDGFINIITDNIVDFDDDEIVTIKDCAMRERLLLETINLKKCTSVGYDSFQDCVNLVSAYLPVCRSIGNTAFYGCNKLESVRASMCTSIGASAFVGCDKLTSINIPSCSSIEDNAFDGCSLLSDVTTGSMRYVDHASFRNTKISSFVSTASGNYYFGSYCFGGCTELTTVDIGGNLDYEYRYSTSFGGCANLESFTIRGTTLPYRWYLPSGYFNGTKIADGSGFIYVREELVDGYRALPGYEEYASQIVAIPYVPPEPEPENGGV